MSGEQIVDLGPITPSNAAQVAAFLHAELNLRVTPEEWLTAIQPPWSTAQPNHGFMLRVGGKVVGAYVAIYSERVIAHQKEQFCNLAAWCVSEDYRSHGLRLLRALLSQKGFHFTDLSPSGNVVALNTRLKFAMLDTKTALVPNLPWPTRLRRVRLTSNPFELEGLLTGQDRQIYLDHSLTLAARHIVIVRGRETCYVIFRRDRRKNLALFASLLYVSNPPLFRETATVFFRYLLVRHRVAATLVELRIVGHRPARSHILRTSRPKMFRSTSLKPSQIDYLYSELTCVPW